MAMSIGATDDSAPIADMNTTPLVDVMLVLLILFIITLPVLTHSTNLHIGRGPESRAVPETISLVIDFDGTIVWNGTVVKDLAQLERYFVNAAWRQGLREGLPRKQAGHPLLIYLDPVGIVGWVCIISSTWASVTVCSSAPDTDCQTQRLG
jgi:hypothetical protein